MGESKERNELFIQLNIFIDLYCSILFFSINVKNFKIDLRKFCDIFLNKWNATTLRNLNDEVFGDEGCFKKAVIFVSWNGLETVFNRYLLTQFPNNANIKIFDYWHSMLASFPLLSVNAQEMLSISCSSLDAERSFSKFRNVQSNRRAH